MSEEVPQLLGMTEAELTETMFFQSITEAPKREEYNDRLYYEFAETGIDFLLSNEPRRVASIFLHGNSYQGELPYSLSFGMSSDEVHRELGKPSVILGGKGKKTLLGPTPPTDRYDWKDVSLAVQYTDDCKRIDLLCLMSSDSVPG